MGGIGIILDMFILFALVGGVLWNMRRGFLRAVLGLLMLFLAMIVSALLYRVLLNWFGANVGAGAGSRSSGPYVFGFMIIVFYLFFEYMVNRNYPGLRIQRLGTWDNILGAVVGIAWSFLAISLFLLTIEFWTITVGPGMPVIDLIGDLLATSFMMPVFRKFFALPLAPLKLLFPAGLPEIFLHFPR
ncbi:MAG TPA: CvpA family protein [Anaerolineae bacterium]|nr:CvpA family protein [Anaerolineae bacterium]